VLVVVLDVHPEADHGAEKQPVAVERPVVAERIAHA
jgi:hypothetical protein